MPAGRRDVLTGAGVVIFGGVGYWQRRRIIRYPEIEELRKALEASIPAVEIGPDVSDDHLEASYDRVRAIFEEMATEIDPAQHRNLRGSVPDEYAPGSLAEATPRERRDALEGLRRETSRATRVVGQHRHEVGELDRGDIDERREAERTALEGFDPPYRGESLTDAIVANAAIDGLREHARGNLASVADNRPVNDWEYANDREYARAWSRLARAAADRHDAEWYARDRTGPDHADRLDSVVADALEAVEASREAVDWEYDDDSGNYAVDLSLSSGPGGERLYGSELPAENRRDGYPASAAQFAAHHHAFFESLEAFAEIPSRRHWREVGWTVDPAELPDRKRAAVAALEGALEDRGDDPLVRWLLSGSIETLERAEGRLERRVEDANDVDDEQWQRAINEYAVRCLEVETFADQVPKTVATLFA